MRRTSSCSCCVRFTQTEQPPKIFKMKYDPESFQPSAEEMIEIRKEVVARNDLNKETEFKPIEWLCNYEIYKTLVEQGFRIMEHVNMEQRNTIIHHVIQNKHLEFLKLLISNGLVTHEKLGNYQGYWYLLDVALRAMENSEDYIPIVEYLINCGCQVNEVNDPEIIPVGYWEFKPLALAAGHSLWKIVDLFLEHGADGHGDLEFHTNCGESLDVDIIPLLNKHNLRFHIESTVDFWEGLLGIHFFKPLSDNIAMKKHYTENLLPMLKALIENGMTFNSVYKGDTKDEAHKMFNLGVVLIEECPAQDEDYMCEVLQLLIDHGYDVTTKDGEKKTPLHMVARVHRDKLMKLIMANGGDLNVVDDYQVTPFLALAAYVSDMGSHAGIDCMERFKRYLDLGGDYNIKLKDCNVPYLLAMLLMYSARYREQLSFLLSEYEVEIPQCLEGLNFGVFQPAILYKMAQVGFGSALEYSLLPLHIFYHALVTQSHIGFELIKHTSPQNTARYLCHIPEFQEKLDEVDFEFCKQVLHDVSQPRSLLTTAIYSIRVALLDCMKQASRKVSLLPRLRVLAKELPWDLRARFTLDCFMTEDLDLPFVISTRRLRKKNKKNGKICGFDGVHEYGYLEIRQAECDCVFPSLEQQDGDDVDSEND